VLSLAYTFVAVERSNSCSQQATNAHFAAATARGVDELLDPHFKSIIGRKLVADSDSKRLVER